MQADLDGAKALFHADGDGLPAPEIDELTKVSPSTRAAPVCHARRV
jgi:hypothetical protein